jgi:hypothetical protein
MSGYDKNVPRKHLYVCRGKRPRSPASQNKRFKNGRLVIAPTGILTGDFNK